MRLALRQTAALTVRQLLALWRQPWFVGIRLLQAMMRRWLLGALLKKVGRMRGFRHPERRIRGAMAGVYSKPNDRRRPHGCAWPSEQPRSRGGTCVNG